MSKYDRFIRDKAEEVKAEHQRLSEAIAEKKRTLQLRAVRSATDLRTTLQQQTQAQLEAQSALVDQRKARAAAERTAAELSLARQRSAVVLRNANIARSVKTAAGSRGNHVH